MTINKPIITGKRVQPEVHSAVYRAHQKADGATATMEKFEKGYRHHPFGDVVSLAVVQLEDQQTNHTPQMDDSDGSRRQSWRRQSC